MQRTVNLAPLTGYVGFLLRRAQGVVFSDFNEALAEVDLRPGQFSVLVMIEENPGTSQSHLSEALGIQKANLVTTIAELEIRGLIDRLRSPSDGRTYELHLSSAGRRLLGRAHELHALHEDRVCSALGAAGRVQLIDLLAKLNRR